jgi:hypothetical protein
VSEVIDEEIFFKGEHGSIQPFLMSVNMYHILKHFTMRSFTFSQVIQSLFSKFQCSNNLLWLVANFAILPKVAYTVMLSFYLTVREAKCEHFGVCVFNFMICASCSWHLTHRVSCVYHETLACPFVHMEFC